MLATLYYLLGTLHEWPFLISSTTNYGRHHPHLEVERKKKTTRTDRKYQARRRSEISSQGVWLHSHCVHLPDYIASATKKSFPLTLFAFTSSRKASPRSHCLSASRYTTGTWFFHEVLQCLAVACAVSAQCESVCMCVSIALLLPKSHTGFQ